ncbi:Levodione reductase [Sutcliffiella rhizosphaerae]|uniref:Levodione reductase n=1 Tax=Sutcliffiella rhizosphaerae TaxID=2880967 RepID=A0ABM8YSW1_9BACI|nr:Levodione reductase [Sutcliffiella rhizosphaerae]
MGNRFDGKVVLITGAGSGLGQATALQIAKEGAKLSLVDLNNDSLEETKKVILEVAPEAEVLLIPADVSREDAVKNFVHKTVDKYSKIDGFLITQELKANKT